MSTRIKLVLFVLAILFLCISTYIAVTILIPSQQVAQAELQGLAGPSIAAETHEGQNTSRFLTLIVVMVAGIVCSHIFEAARSSGPTINVVKVVSEMLTSSRFIMAVVVTPLIFNSIYIAIGVNPQNMGDYLLAFQNGFFWETIMAGFSRNP